MADETILLTIILKHDQSQNIDQIQGTLAERAWWDRFPPQGCEIVSWTVAMGLGQIVTLRLPPRLLELLMAVHDVDGVVDIQRDGGW